jgi:hypothetical protein
MYVCRRNYSLAGVRTLVDWISEVHCPVEGGRPLHAHPRIAEFLQLIQNKLLKGQTALHTKKLLRGGISKIWEEEKMKRAKQNKAKLEGY